MKVDRIQTSVRQHTGMALVTESSVTMPSLNHNSVAVSSSVLSKRPSCVKYDNAQFTTGLTIRSRYVGEVSCSNHLPADNFNKIRFSPCN